MCPIIGKNVDKTTQITNKNKYIWEKTQRKEYSIQLDNAFELSSHLDVIKRLGFMDVLEKEGKDENDMEKLTNLVPELFKPYIKRNYH